MRAAAYRCTQVATHAAICAKSPWGAGGSGAVALRQENIDKAAS